MTSEKQPVTIPVLQNIKAHRLLFYIALPVCFVVCMGVMSCIPKYFKSSFIITREREQAVEMERAITLNQPANYDLGLARTENAIEADGYSVILASDDFLYGLFDEPVHTLDNSWEGSLGEYMSACLEKPFWGRWADRILGRTNDGPIHYDPEEGWYTARAVETIGKMRKAIKAELNYENRFVTITCTTQDPLVATQMARAVNEHLLHAVDAYEIGKMQHIHNQIQMHAEEAEAAGNAAMAASFRRQASVYEAQMIHHPAYATLSVPTVDYSKAGPSRWKMPLVLTILLGLCLLGWVERKDMLRYIAG